MAVKLPAAPNEEKRNYLAIHFPADEALTDERLLKLSAANGDLRLERSPEGDLIVMAPAGSESSHRNANITFQLYAWWRQHREGKVFDSSGGFSLPNGAVRAPDAAWVSDEQLSRLTSEEFKSYPPLCPDFVIELRSASDSLRESKEKVQEYLENGAKLGWLIDPQGKRVFVYTPEGSEELKGPETVSAAPLLDFELDMLELWK